MRAFEFERCALSVCVAALLLSACGGSSMPIQASHDALSPTTSKNSKTFTYTHKKQSFVVPPGVTQLTVVALGGEGDAGPVYYPSADTPGSPGRVYAIIPVHPRQRLDVYVGGSGAHGGFNGGGTGVNRGGGASDVRLHGGALTDRIIVAAGGGGAGEAIYTYGTAYGGKGGGLAGQSGGGGGSSDCGAGGTGATQTDGGSGGAGGARSSRSAYNGQPGGDGTLGIGGSGGQGASSGSVAGGGGGGGGYYGGGGGGGGGYVNYYSRYESSLGGGGGGGSSYVEPSAIKSRTWTGWKKAPGDGLVVLSW